MGIPAKARNRKYDIDRMMKDYLSVMANRAHYSERIAFLSQRASCGRIKLESGWQRRFLMDLIFPPPVAAEQPGDFVRLLYRPRLSIGLGLELVAKMQGGLCYLCGEEFSSDDAPTREHVIPWARGGRDARNILAAHTSCNNRKAARMSHPCEALFCEAVYLRLEKVSARGRRKAAPLAEQPG